MGMKFSYRCHFATCGVRQKADRLSYFYYMTPEDEPGSLSGKVRAYCDDHHPDSTLEEPCFRLMPKTVPMYLYLLDEDYSHIVKEDKFPLPEPKKEVDPNAEPEPFLFQYELKIKHLEEMIADIMGKTLSIRITDRKMAEFVLKLMGANRTGYSDAIRHCIQYVMDRENPVEEEVQTPAIEPKNLFDDHDDFAPNEEPDWRKMFSK